MTDTVRTENEVLENEIFENEVPENEEAVGQAEAAKKVNPLYRAWCVFINWFGFGSKLYGSNKHRKKIFFDVITYVILIVGALTMLYPFWWMLVASVNDSTYNMYQTVFWPRSVADGNIFYNYSRVISNFSLTMGGVSYWRIVLNTILYSVVPVVVIALYVQMPVLLVDLQRVEMSDEGTEVVPVGYKVPALAGTVPSAAGTRDEEGVFFQQAVERAGEIFPVRLVL